MKKILWMVLVVLSVLVMAGCGGSSIGGNIIKDEGALVKIMDDFKNLDDLKGKDILVFQDVNVYTGETGNRVVINDARRAQALHPRGIDRGGGGVGREGIGRMDMVVDVLRHHGREFGGLQNLFEICKAFFPCGRVEFVQNVDLDHRTALSSA